MWNFHCNIAVCWFWDVVVRDSLKLELVLSLLQKHARYTCVCSLCCGMFSHHGACQGCVCLELLRHCGCTAKFAQSRVPPTLNSLISDTVTPVWLSISTAANACGYRTTIQMANGRSVHNHYASTGAGCDGWGMDRGVTSVRPPSVPTTLLQRRTQHVCLASTLVLASIPSIEVSRHST